AFLKLGLLVVLGLRPVDALARGGTNGPNDQIVMLGLRPLTAANGPTELRRLSDAQKARSLLENILQFISAREVAGPDDHRQLLGNAYMVDLFACEERIDCVVNRIAPLRRAGYTSAVYGSYWVDGDTNHFRLFTFTLADGKVTKHVEFDLTAAQLE